MPGAGLASSENSLLKLGRETVLRENCFRFRRFKLNLTFRNAFYVLPTRRRNFYGCEFCL